MHAVIAIFYGLFTWLAAIFYILIAWPDYLCAAIVLGPIITSGMSLALLALDAIVVWISKTVTRWTAYMTKKENRRF